MTPAKKKVLRAFGAADHYHRYAWVQQQVAQALATVLEDRRLPSRPRIWEVGCGTGFLSQHLLKRWPEGCFLLSDLSWSMVRRCQANLGRPSETVFYAVLDGEQPALSACSSGFDLIASSLVFQWFSNPIQRLAELSALLRPGGSLVFATLGHQTFHEWQAACTSLEVASGLLTYPSAVHWQEGWRSQGMTQMREEYMTVNYPSSLSFLRELKAIGAHQPHSAYYPHAAGVLRRLLRHLDQGHGLDLTYHLLYGVFVKSL